MVIATAAVGFKYYLSREGVPDSSRYIIVRSRAKFDSASALPGNTQLVMTFPRALRLEAPAFDRELQSHWQKDTTFAATVGDGEISVWSRRGGALPN